MARGVTSRACSKRWRVVAPLGRAFAGFLAMRGAHESPRRSSRVKGGLQARPKGCIPWRRMTTSPPLSAAFPLGALPDPTDLTRLTRPLTFEQLAALPDECIDAAVGAALIARDAYGPLDADRLPERLDDLAAPLAGRDLASLPPEAQA